MPLTWKDRIKVASATTGTGTLTLGSAASGYRTFAAGDDGKVFAYVIEDGTAWETGFGTYTHSGTTFARTSRSDSSTGSAISCSGAEYLFVDLIATNAANLTGVLQTHISGLLVTKNAGGNTLDISAGSCYDPSSNKVVTYSGGTAVSAGSLGASQWNQVYIYDNAGTATIEVVNNADPPSTTYVGNARKGGTGGERRWVGSFLTTAGSAIASYALVELAQGTILVTPAFLCRIVNAGTATSYGAISSAAAYVPRYVCTEMFCNLSYTYTATAAASLLLLISNNGSDDNAGGASGYVFANNAILNGTIWLINESSTPGIYYKMAAASPGAGPAGYVDIWAYKVRR